VNRGYFGIGIYHTKTEVNVGTLWRSAYQLGAAFVFTIGRRYKQQASDTYKTARHTPLYHYTDFASFQDGRPYGAELVGVELDEKAKPIPGFVHPQRAIYLLGAEDHGLPPEIVAKCQHLVTLQGGSFNVAVAGSIVMYDRQSRNLKEPK
jgi:tRNA G18 (ribose-2'-O)-methylase SpoU